MHRFVCCLAITMLLLACAYTGEQEESRTDKEIQASPPQQGPLTDERIQAVFDQNKKALYYIYQGALRNDPTLKGKLVLKITVATSGQVLASAVESSEIRDYNLERKIAARVKLFDFGKCEQQLTFTYPIDFIPR